MTSIATEPIKTLTRLELYDLIWAEPMTKVAPRFGLSDVGLAKVCKRYDIPRPPVGYWAQKQVGKEPERSPLPPTDEKSQQTIEFAQEEKVQRTQPQTAADKVNDDNLKKLIEFEELPKNRITVNENVAKYHTFVRDAKSSFSDGYANRQGLHSPNWSNQGARVSISVTKDSRHRALRLMDALVKAFEQRGHQVIVEGKDHRRDVLFAIFGEKFSLRLREKTKMIRIPESERKSLYSDRVRYEPTGLLELQLCRTQTGFSEHTWKDGKRRKLEEQLNEVMIGLIVAVEKERNWRRQREESERQRREDEAKRWQQEQERRKDEQKIGELNQMIDNWNRAADIRELMADVRSTVEQRNGPIDEESDLAKWIDWALKHADRIDPLGATRGANLENWVPPSRPR
jgi:hypothetical protein